MPPCQPDKKGRKGLVKGSSASPVQGSRLIPLSSPSRLSAFSHLPVMRLRNLPCRTEMHRDLLDTEFAVDFFGMGLS